MIRDKGRLGWQKAVGYGRRSVGWGNRRVPVQDHHRSWPARPDSARPEDRGPGRLLGAQPDDPARHAGVAAHRLTDSDS